MSQVPHGGLCQYTVQTRRTALTDVLPAEGTDEAGLLRVATAVEAGSAHPLALAVIQEAGARSIPIPPARAASAVPGKAAVANVDGVRVTVGSPAFAAECGTDLGPLVSRVEALEAEGKTVVIVFARDYVFGVLALRDEPRADAAVAVAALKRMGVASVMLTGDNERTGRAIAGKLGLEVRAHLLPDEKLREIGASRAQGPMAMVGDGINDAPALAAASVGIAMGGGTTAALEAADAALLSGRVSGVAELVALSRATLTNVQPIGATSSPPTCPGKRDHLAHDRGWASLPRRKHVKKRHDKLLDYHLTLTVLRQEGCRYAIDRHHLLSASTHRT